MPFYKAMVIVKGRKLKKKGKKKYPNKSGNEVNSWTNLKTVP